MLDVPSFRWGTSALLTLACRPLQVTVQHPEYYEKVVYIKKGLAGVGPECRARHFCSGNPLEQ